jgi:hypothetical protein
MSKHTATIVTRAGTTGKDHLLAEIAASAQARMKPGYSSKSAAKKAAERAWFAVVASRELYAGCGAGFGGAV